MAASDPIQDDPILSVVIPMYNEQARIGATLADTTRTLRALPITSEILLVNDGSRDATAHQAAQWATDSPDGNLLRVIATGYPANRGKGHAVRFGLTKATGRWRLIMDADNACRVSEVTRLFAVMNAARPVPGLIAGSRYRADAKVTTSPKRRLTAGVFRLALRMLGLRLLSDTQCGFKLYRADLAAIISSAGIEDGFIFDVEHLLIARAAGVPIAEVGVEWHEQAGSTVDPVRDGLRMLLGACRIRARWITGRIRVPRAAADIEFKPVRIEAPLSLTGAAR